LQQQPRAGPFPLLGTDKPLVPQKEFTDDQGTFKTIPLKIQQRIENMGKPVVSGVNFARAVG
jgi:hypothetical protein